VPGGFLEQHETVEEAVLREVAEEAGITAQVEGVLGLRNRYDPDTGNSLYVVLLLRPLNGEPRPDGREVDQAGYFTLEEILTLEQVPPVNIQIAQRALAPDRRLLAPRIVAHSSGALYTLFVG
jgi:ADP-ribose pyrophosphatase YjhB (NUDIX family)